MSEKSDRVKLTKEQALAMLPDGERVHTTVNSAPGVLIGADCDREDVVALIEAFGAELSGEVAARTGHGMALHDGERWLFIETRKDATPPAAEAVATPYAEAAQTVEHLLHLFRNLTQLERETLLDLLFQDHCRKCGGRQGTRECRCGSEWRE